MPDRIDTALKNSATFGQLLLSLVTVLLAIFGMDAARSAAVSARIDSNHNDSYLIRSDLSLTQQKVSVLEERIKIYDGMVQMRNEQVSTINQRLVKLELLAQIEQDRQLHK